MNEAKQSNSREEQKAWIKQNWNLMDGKRLALELRKYWKLYGNTKPNQEVKKNSEIDKIFSS